MKRTLILALLAASPAFAQSGNAVFVQASGTSGPIMGAALTARAASAAPVLGAPYSATVKSDLIQTLTDGNRIVITTTSTIARDSEGRTRQNAPVPSVGFPANAPQLVFIQDPVAQTAYTLNLTDKTAHKMPAATTASPAIAGASSPVSVGPIASVPAPVFFMRVSDGAEPPPMPPLPPAPGMQIMIANGPAGETGAASTEDLGSQTMQGLFVTGTRTTRTIPAGAIGNEQPISIVSEVWTSPDLKTVVYSKRSDPRTGEQTFELTNVSRAEPDPSLFAPPSDFKMIDGPQPIVLSRTER